MSDMGHTPHHNGHRTPSRPKSVAARSLPELAAPEETASKSDTLAVLKRLRSVRERSHDGAPRRGLAAFLPSRLFDHANRHAAEAEAEADDEIDPAALLGPREAAADAESANDTSESRFGAVEIAEADDADDPEETLRRDADPLGSEASGGDAATAGSAASHGVPFNGYGWATETDIHAAPLRSDEEEAPVVDAAQVFSDDGFEATEGEWGSGWDEPRSAERAGETAREDTAPDADLAQAGDLDGEGTEDMQAGDASGSEATAAVAERPSEPMDAPAAEDTPDADDDAALAILNEVAAQIAVREAADAPEAEPDAAGDAVEPASAFLIPNDSPAEEPTHAPAGEMCRDALSADHQDEVVDAKAGADESDPWDSLIAAALESDADNSGQDESDEDVTFGADDAEPVTEAARDGDVGQADATATDDPWGDAIRAFTIQDSAVEDHPPGKLAADDVPAEEPALQAEDAPNGLDIDVADSAAGFVADDEDSEWNDDPEDVGAPDHSDAGLPEAESEAAFTTDAQAHDAEFDEVTDAFPEMDDKPNLGADNGSDAISDGFEDPEWSMFDTVPGSLSAAYPEDAAAIDGAAGMPEDDVENEEAFEVASAAPEDFQAPDADTPDLHAAVADEDDKIPGDRAAAWSYEDEQDDTEFAGPDRDRFDDAFGTDAELAPEADAEDGDDAMDAAEAVWTETDAVFLDAEEAPEADDRDDNRVDERAEQDAWGLDTETPGVDEAMGPETALALDGDADAEDDAVTDDDLADGAGASEDLIAGEYDTDFDETSGLEAADVRNDDARAHESESETRNAVLDALNDTDTDAEAAETDAGAPEPHPAAEVTPLRVPAMAADLRTADELDTPDRKPRIALMGEFSAGKSTLSNLLIGANPLPTKVTATQLPPVWISYGDGQPYREDIDGETHPIAPEELAYIDPARTQMVRLFAKSETLELCDIIDMPGISDPNMASEVWERMIGKADGVIWCTHATQAWRQSEAAVWETLEPALHAKSLLLVTRFDKLLSEKDRARVLKRLQRETEGLFRDCLPISLLDALTAEDDQEKWEASGAEAFTGALQGLLNDMSDTLGQPRRARPGRPLSQFAPRHRDAMAEDPEGDGGARTPSRIAPRRIVPRRVSRDAAGIDPSV